MIDTTQGAAIVITKRDFFGATGDNRGATAKVTMGNDNVRPSNMTMHVHLHGGAEVSAYTIRDHSYLKVSAGLVDITFSPGDKCATELLALCAAIGAVGADLARQLAERDTAAALVAVAEQITATADGSGE